MRSFLIVYRKTSIGGADLGAFTAVRAKVDVNLIDRVACRDRVFRAFRQTGITHDAIGGDNVSQRTSHSSAARISITSMAAKAKNLSHIKNNGYGCQAHFAQI